MGRYINEDSKGNPIGASASDKVKNLVADGAKVIPGGEYVPNMVCVVNNYAFAAAGYCYDEREYQDFRHPDGRPKTWLQYEHAEKLAK